MWNEVDSTQPYDTATTFSNVAATQGIGAHSPFYLTGSLKMCDTFLYYSTARICREIAVASEAELSSKHAEVPTLFSNCLSVDTFY